MLNKLHLIARSTS